MNSTGSSTLCISRWAIDGRPPSSDQAGRGRRDVFFGISMLPHQLTWFIRRNERTNKRERVAATYWIWNIVRSFHRATPARCNQPRFYPSLHGAASDYGRDSLRYDTISALSCEGTGNGTDIFYPPNIGCSGRMQKKNDRSPNSTLTTDVE